MQQDRSALSLQERLFDVEGVVHLFQEIFVVLRGEDLSELFWRVVVGESQHDVVDLLRGDLTLTLHDDLLEFVLLQT